MKWIKCIIRPGKVDDVIRALSSVASGMTVSEARGYGRQKGQPVLYHGVEYQVTLLPKIAIEIVSDDNRVDDVVRTLIKTARTGNIGDGRIFIYPVEAAYHVRTGFMDQD